MMDTNNDNNKTFYLMKQYKHSMEIINFSDIQNLIIKVPLKQNI